MVSTPGVPSVPESDTKVASSALEALGGLDFVNVVIPGILEAPGVRTLSK